MLPLRDTVLFPNSFMPLAVARESSVRLIDDAIAAGKLIGVFAQRDPALDEPIQADLYPVGTATHIHKMFRLPDGSLRLIVQGCRGLRSTRSSPETVSSRDGLGRRRRAARRRQSRDRRAAEEHQEQFPEGRLAVAAAVRRPADAGDEHRGAGAPGRLHRLEPEHDQHRRPSRKCSKRSTSGRAWTA